MVCGSRHISETDNHDLPAGALYRQEYISPAEANHILAKLDHEVWVTDLKRRVQHYGYRYDYRARRASKDDYLGPLPIWLQEIAEKLFSDGYFSNVPEQVIINEYEPGQGIAPHIDCEPCFGSVIASISLGSFCEMSFQHKATREHASIVLAPNSLLVLSDKARYEWTHGIASRKSDRIHGKRIHRQRRVSLTFRTMEL